MRRSYAVITPARDEAANLPRLASCIASQTILPSTWTIVENGSSDTTLEIAHGLAAEHAWVNVLTIPGSQSADRGAPVVRALQAGIGALESAPDFVVNMDADISIASDYFERLLTEFAADSSLGIASGSLFELQRGSWRQRHAAGHGGLPTARSVVARADHLRHGSHEAVDHAAARYVLGKEIDGRAKTLYSRL